MAGIHIITDQRPGEPDILTPIKHEPLRLMACGKLFIECPAPEGGGTRNPCRKQQISCVVDLMRQVSLMPTWARLGWGHLRSEVGPSELMVDALHSPVSIFWVPKWLR